MAMAMMGGFQILAQAPAPTPDLTTASLEDLMRIEVISVSKREEKLFQSAAAIYVITQEEIRRSGMTNIPDLLRLVPGLSVARIDGNKWAVSIRGFNTRFANKLLILIDGRSIYSPEFSGVYWEGQDLSLEEIERIEVIRGPGGTLWGANAVNGVINIITKRARDSQGGLVTAGGGSDEQGFTSLRYGGTIGAGTHYRVYAKYFNRGGQVDDRGRDLHDWQNWLSGGWRMDWKRSQRDSLTWQGNIHDTAFRERSLLPVLPDLFAPPALSAGEITGGNVLGRWNHVFSDRSDTALQIYFDRFSRTLRDVGERIDTLDLDFQHHLGLGRRQNLVYGLGYRRISDRTTDNSRLPVQFMPKAQTIQIFNVFLQDEVTLVPNQLRLTLGSKLEHHDYTGYEVQPSVRLAWTPSARQTVWAAVSRAVRTPARIEQGARIYFQPTVAPTGLIVLTSLSGSPKTRSEELRAYELGYRIEPGGRLLFDISAFHNFYDRLSSTDPGIPVFEFDPPPPHLLVPLVYGNQIHGKTYGAEFAVNWELNSRWKLRGGYSYLGTELDNKLSGPEQIVDLDESTSPRHQFQLHSYFKLPRNFEFDPALYYASRLPAANISSYTRLDLRFGWQPRENFRLSLGLQNLLDAHHLEYRGPDTAVFTSEVKRGIYGKATWRF